MELPEEPTLLQTVLVNAPLQEDVERSWAFALFCGLFESSAHAEFIRLAGEKSADALELADALLDLATRRSELVDLKSALAGRLWQYFQVGQSLEPEPDEGTQPGLTLPTDVSSGG
jgi:hypothetical protein